MEPVAVPRTYKFIGKMTTKRDRAMGRRDFVENRTDDLREVGGFAVDRNAAGQPPMRQVEKLRRHIGHSVGAGGDRAPHVRT